MIFSICIPTYNRVDCLDDCLNSILIASTNCEDFNYEICISDNCSEENVSIVIEKYQNKLPIKFNKNVKNLGFAINAMKVVSMSSGDYVWMIGNDDLILPDTLLEIKNLLKKNKDVEYFFVNSFHLKSKFLEEYEKPFDTRNLPLEKMKTISKLKQDKQATFWDVIDPDVSWDYLTGIFLSIFKREKWEKNKSLLNLKQLEDNRYWSTSDNTLMHAKIFCRSFKNSKCFISAKPLSVNLIGEREWGDLYEFIEIVRIPEIIEFYRSEGLSFKKYFYNKNFALRNYLNYLIKIILGGKKKGLNYLNFKRDIIDNLIFPNVYLSIFFSGLRYIKKRIIKLDR